MIILQNGKGHKWSWTQKKVTEHEAREEWEWAADPEWRDEPRKGASQKRVLKEVEMSVSAAEFARMHLRKPSLCVVSSVPPYPHRSPSALAALFPFLQRILLLPASCAPLHMLSAAQSDCTLDPSHLVNVCTSCKFQLSHHEYRKAWADSPGHTLSFQITFLSQLKSLLWLQIHWM